MIPAVHKMLQRAGYWKYGGSARVESYPMLPDAIASAEAYVMELGAEEDDELLDGTTPLIARASTKKLNRAAYSGLVGAKMSGVNMAPDVNSIN